MGELAMLAQSIPQMFARCLPDIRLLAEATAADPVLEEVIDGCYDKIMHVMGCTDCY